MANLVVWFDIPVTDMARARAFYGTILGGPVTDMPGAESTVALLPMEMGWAGGDLVLAPERVSSTQGCTVYLNGRDDLSVILDKVEGAGGTVLMPKSNMGEMVGSIAYFLDTEGNRIGLHSVG